MYLFQMIFCSQLFLYVMWTQKWSIRLYMYVFKVILGGGLSPFIWR